MLQDYVQDCRDRGVLVDPFAFAVASVICGLMDTMEDITTSAPAIETVAHLTSRGWWSNSPGRCPGCGACPPSVVAEGEVVFFVPPLQTRHVFSRSTPCAACFGEA